MEFPDFDDNLRGALEREAGLFFDSIVREDRNVLDLMNADYTFVNERLAKHYGIPNVYGSRWRRVTLTDEARKGLLGKGAILTVTSNADRTSPVVRGKWMLDNILNAPPAAAAAGRAAVARGRHARGRVLPMRERMEEHRKNPVCANCHKLFDPIGLAMENFDADRPVADGRRRSLGGARSTRRASCRTAPRWTAWSRCGARSCRSRSCSCRTVVEKLMTYGLGRGVTAHDMPTVRAIVRQTAASDYRFSAIVLGIVKSPPFTMRIKAAPAATTVAAR